MYIDMFAQFKKMLNQMDHWLTTAGAYAKEKSFDPKVFMELRLAPDQFPFARQVRMTCDTAKLAASRLSGKEAPVHADTETSLEELSARIKSTIAYLDGFTAKDFAEAATRTVTQPRWEGKTLTGAAYFIEHAVPNFFFHLSTAYALLRHSGMKIGKSDFLGTLSFRAPN